MTSFHTLITTTGVPRINIYASYPVITQPVCLHLGNVDYFARSPAFFALALTLFLPQIELLSCLMKEQSFK
jgi:hypothetical protein